jgi:hypothetical protein
VDAPRPGAKASKAVGRSNTFSDESNQDDDLPDIGFSSFHQFSGNALWQESSSASLGGLSFQSQSPLVFGGGMPVSLAPGQVNASSATWGVGGLAPASKISGLYGFGLGEGGAEWASHSVDSSNQWDSEMLAGFNNLVLDNSGQLPESELNPSAPEVDSFGRLVRPSSAPVVAAEVEVSDSTVGKKHHKGNQRNNNKAQYSNKSNNKSSNLKPEVTPPSAEGGVPPEVVPHFKNNNHPNKRGKGGKGNKQSNAQPAAEGEPITPSGEVSSNSHKKGRGKGKGGKGGKGEKPQDPKKQPDASSDGPSQKNEPSRKRGKGGKGKKESTAAAPAASE